MIKTPPSGFTVRSPHLEDLEAITDLAHTSEIALHGGAETTLEDVQHAWRSPGFNPETDSRVIFSPSGQLYERAGMHIVRQRDRYEKELRAGRELSTQAVEG